jgi:hypothetical protein
MANDIIPIENTTELQTPLRGVLKNPHEKMIDVNYIKQRLTLICLLLLFIVIILPIMIYILILWF